jgi:hypothetical protein
VTIPVPTDAPVLCSPSPVNVTAGQTTTVNCTAAGYIGPFTFTVGDPTIASVSQGSSATLFNVTGLKSGMTTLNLQFPPGGTGSVTIIVSP